MSTIRFEKLRAKRASGDQPGAAGDVPALKERLRNVEHQVECLLLLNQALWELARHGLGLSDDDLARLVGEIDRRDGIRDGRMTDTGIICPACRGTLSSRHDRCVYCGYQFDDPSTGA